jgi:hypothetical protein
VGLVAAPAFYMGEQMKIYSNTYEDSERNFYSYHESQEEAILAARVKTEKGEYKVVAIGKVIDVEFSKKGIVQLLNDYAFE